MVHTSLTIKDKKLHKKAKKRAIDLGFKNLSEYLFSLVEKDIPPNRLKNEKIVYHPKDKDKMTGLVTMLLRK